MQLIMYVLARRRKREISIHRERRCRDGSKERLALMFGVMCPHDRACRHPSEGEGSKVPIPLRTTGGRAALLMPWRWPCDIDFRSGLRSCERTTLCCFMLSCLWWFVTVAIIISNAMLPVVCSFNNFPWRFGLLPVLCSFPLQLPPYWRDSITLRHGEMTTCLRSHALQTQLYLVQSSFLPTG